MVKGSGNLSGIISCANGHGVLQNQPIENLVVAKDIATSKVITVNPDESLCRAFEKIAARDLSILPVVSRANPDRLLGIVTRKHVIGVCSHPVIKKPLSRKRHSSMLGCYRRP